MVGWQSSDAISIVCVAVSLGLFAYTRTNDRDPRALLDLGLVFMVFSLGRRRPDRPLGAGTRGAIPRAHLMVGAVVLMFAAIVPSTPIRRSSPG